MAGTSDDPEETNLVERRIDWTRGAASGCRLQRYGRRKDSFWKGLEIDDQKRRRMVGAPTDGMGRIYLERV